MRFRHPATLFLAIVCLTPIAQGQVVGGDSLLVPSATRTRPTAYVGTDLVGIYSPAYGVGFDGILGLRDFPFDGSSLRLHLWPSRYRRVAFATFSLTDAEQSPLIVTGHVLGEWNRRDRFTSFFGTEKDQWRQYDRNSRVVELKLGYQSHSSGIAVLPFVRYEHHHIFDGNHGPGFPVMPEGGFQFARNPTMSGYAYGVDLLFDQTDSRVAPTNGFAFHAGVTHLEVASSDIDCSGECNFVQYPFERPASFDRIDLGAYGYLPLWAGHVLATRLLVTEIPGSYFDRELPYYLAPSVDHRLLPGYGRNRFTADRFAIVSLEYRIPVANIFELYRIEVLAHAGVAWIEPPIGERLDQPGFAIGIRTASLANERVLINWMIGFGPEGLSTVPFRSEFQPDPRISYPTLR